MEKITKIESNALGKKSVGEIEKLIKKNTKKTRDIHKVGFAYFKMPENKKKKYKQ